jgi:hypothetical protein
MKNILCLCSMPGCFKPAPSGYCTHHQMKREQLLDLAVRSHKQFVEYAKENFSKTDFETIMRVVLEGNYFGRKCTHAEQIRTEFRCLQKAWAHFEKLHSKVFA